MSGIFLVLLLASPQTVHPPVVVVKNAKQPRLAIDREGNPVVVFVHEGNVRVALSPDGGKTFSEPVTAIDAAGKAAAAFQRGPRIAVDRSGRIFVTAPLPLNKKAVGTASFIHVNDLFFAVSTDKGETFSKPVMINDTPATAVQSLHDIAVSAGGDLHVVWLDNRTGKGQSLFSTKVNYRTKKPPKNKPLVETVCENCAPGLALGTSTAPFLIYREGGKKQDRRVMVGKVGAKARRGLFKKKDDDPSGYLPVSDIPSGVSHCPMDSPAVAAGPEGKIAVAWMDPRDRTDGENVHWTSGRLGKLPREHYTHSDRRFYQGRPTVVFDDKGTVWCAWEDGRDQVQTIMAVSSERANKEFPVSTVEEDRGGFPSIASGGGIVGIAYEAGEHVHFRIIAGPE